MPNPIAIQYIIILLLLAKTCVIYNRATAGVKAVPKQNKYRKNIGSSKRVNATPLNFLNTASIFPNAPDLLDDFE